MTALKTDITSNLPSKDFLGFGLYDEAGINYKNVSGFLKFDKNELSKISGVSKSSVRTDHKAPEALKDRLDEIAIVCALVAEFFDGDVQKTALWFKTPNPMLGDITPRDMIRLGRAKKLIRFIVDAKNENQQGQN